MAVNKHPIPDDKLIPAINEAQRMPEFGGHCADKWGEEQASIVRRLCGEEYYFVETDFIRSRAINLRKAHKLESVNGGPKRKKYEPPSGEYEEYLKSEHWIAYRETVLVFWDFKCCLCFKKANDVHHRTYIRVGYERESDCVALCKRCHKRVHGVMDDGNAAFNEDNLDQLF